MNEQPTVAIREQETPLPADVPAQQPETIPMVDFDTILMEDLPTNIRVCEQNIQINGWMLGGMLISAKKRLPHGAFMDWLNVHTDISQSTANNLMALHNGVMETPFLARIKQSAAVQLLALLPAQREQYAAEHDVQATSVRQLRDDVARLQHEASEANAKAATVAQIAADAQAAVVTKAGEVEAAQRAATTANGLYEALNEQYTTAQRRIDELERSLSDAPVTITTLEVERVVEVLPPDYERLKDELNELSANADRMEADLRKARADLLRESAQEKQESGGLAGFKQAAADFLARGYLMTAIGTSVSAMDDNERAEYLRCIDAVEDLCIKARKAVEDAPLHYRAADAQVE